MNERKEVFCFILAKRKLGGEKWRTTDVPSRERKGGKVVRARAIPTGQRSFTRGLSGSEANAHEYGDPPIKGRKKRRRW